MANAFDFKKEYKDLYMPKGKPGLIDVPEMLFLMVDGKGDPNNAPAYAEALELLYGLSYSVKMSKMSGTQPAGYFDYVVPPLEGLWWTAEGGYDGSKPGEKDRFLWTAMIRQPEFVTQDALEAAKAALLKKRPELPVDKARLQRWTEGVSVQIMHIGSYDDEPASIAMMDAFLEEHGYRCDFSDERNHHEIYLSDPRKTPPEKRKTVIRHPAAKA